MKHSAAESVAALDEQVSVARVHLRAVCVVRGLVIRMARDALTESLCARLPEGLDTQELLAVWIGTRPCATRACNIWAAVHVLFSRHGAVAIEPLFYALLDTLRATPEHVRALDACVDVFGYGDVYARYAPARRVADLLTARLEFYALSQPRYQGTEVIL